MISDIESRLAFEKMASINGNWLDVIVRNSFDEDAYKDGSTQLEWLAWQAAIQYANEKGKKLMISGKH